MTALDPDALCACLDRHGVRYVLIGGLAAESLAYPKSETRGNEHVANFALGGMAIGLIGAGILTRNLETPKLPVSPALGTVTGTDGSSTTTYGFTGAW